jgi:hypothetical protein
MKSVGPYHHRSILILVYIARHLSNELYEIIDAFMGSRPMFDPMHSRDLMEGNNHVHTPIGLSPKSNDFIKHVTWESNSTHATDPSIFVG